MDNQHYRYCFQCDQWKNKTEINEVDLGEGNKTFNCNVCRKDLGENIQIFRCRNHPQEILKVWGVLEGQNQKKIFYSQCPQELRQAVIGKTLKIILTAGGIMTLLVGLMIIIKKINNKKK